MSQEWYYLSGGQIYGPLTAAQLREYALAGQVAPTDHVRRGGVGNWVGATKVKGLFDPSPAPPLADLDKGPFGNPQTSLRESITNVRPPLETSAALHAPKMPNPPLQDLANSPDQSTTAIRTLSVRLLWVVGGAITLLLFVAVIAAILTSRPSNTSTNTAKPEIKISDVFRDQLIRFLEVSGELEASTGQGVNISTLKEHLAKVKSSYELVSATWPEGFEPEVRQSFDSAINGWELALRLWAGKIAQHDDPTEPNFNGYAEYIAYAGDALKTGEWSIHSPERYIGKKKIYKNDYNVGVLLALASAHSKSGKARVLAAIVKNQ